MNTTHKSALTVEEKLALALTLLAEWVVAVKHNGTGWDDWDTYYKDAAYAKGPLRKDLDAEIERVRKLYYEEDDE